MAKPTLFFLHALGSSSNEWSGVIQRLEARFDCVALDIPGFGDAPPLQHVDTAALVDWFVEEVIRRQPTCWFAIGHSMGGKIATLAAAQARDGMAGLAGLAGMILVAASPPAPEPMDESRRQTMLAWFEKGHPTRQEAEQFIDDNCAVTLPAPIRNAAVDDVLRTSAKALIAWLAHASREDYSAQAGYMHVPALIIAGSEDGDLGEAAQTTLNAPHYHDARLAVVADAAHLIPYEQPQHLAQLIAAHVDRSVDKCLPDDFIRLLNADRVAPRMRKLLLSRHAGPPATAQGVLSQHQLELLTAVVARVLDGAGDAREIARRMDIQLAEGAGDGWRHAALPPDRLAMPLGLDTLDALSNGFAGLPAETQDRWLREVSQSTAGDDPSAHGLDAAQLAHWFEDVRAEAARIWISLPATMAAMGYDGFAVGGAGIDSAGYQQTAADQQEAWQLPAKGLR
ncbi:alpha/beta fold hydrolase [Xanthomonas hortorum pv. vitians]|uniref:alpha/beta hydrolase n=1 Tax=Xanthomonas hortorum TaxID=56454 RepID=UPI0012A818D7|nr:alpha/beta fold hydrolase [Xanthomonas hortorum]MCE4283051.1 alpha/beta fold hydrolase [Xanthomonas hortorum pv. vitians]MCE4286459.1 alpha/beta fold hydrolase [Xanthomonas hortorum pv. vitians]MCE4291049.1 alpha/beta fold hydrolase [Xanthomonas hortorum pv. vitians]MCE4295197.1 alpha/beta fold hydrolase [Xanthomonas hortorum pv. vitians]MCE4517246.1 alpha/beta fold hydrolase [Xanthomonas hortorum pv. vitians]